MAAILTITVNPALDVSFEVERMTAESKLRATKVVYQPGGGGINVARAASRLGADVRAAWMGGGANATRLATLLEDEQVAHHRLDTRGETRLSIHVEERATTDMYRFVLPGATVDDAEAESVARCIASTSAPFIVLSGSLPAGAPADFYARLAARAPAGARVLLDTSGEALDRGLAGGVYLAKPNRNELGRLVGRSLASIEDIERAAREIVNAGRVETLAVSAAEQGLVLVTRDTAAHIPAPQVQMVSAVGAGDSTVAGIVVGLARGLSLVEAGRLGVACGTATVLSEGTSLFRREDVERIFATLGG